ncbi:ABC transporter substrate-binding protein [Aquibaculum arenosum]|uniref:ABC transporter substrate-binding protein n=1 Tax=Aquibaculum arenosum TaxID=3032591 RepID=A0ABT5YPI8_9PROT|nr:ABC transporter substrate-binding protein [Fodinicurvata sp. CAU 1616]MDF2096889.1 ABC transporter substrate-binding protein [Fodinicurvata sp. CAU 1616]
MKVKAVMFGLLVGTALTGMQFDASAETLRFASQSDALTLDPHAQNEGPTITMAQQIYDPLVIRADDMTVRPGLAVSWEAMEPTVWEFKLREGVSFHDGSAFTAEDAAFSLDRARVPPSDYRNYVSSIEEVSVVDEHTLRITTQAPNPILPQQLTNIVIMSKAWAEEHGVEQTQNYAEGEENHAVRNANGTGAFRLESREPDVRTVLVRNDDYWDRENLPMEVERVVSTPVSSSATRVAALLSGELDLILYPPVQDLRRLEQSSDIAVKNTPENRTIFLGLNQGADDLESDSVEGENPLADKRVREAINLAIDVDAIQRVVMRGQSVPAGSISPTYITGYKESFDERPPHDQERAKELLAEAGYEEGFEIDFACPNDRYNNDEAICQAIVGMLGQVGIDANLNAQTRSLHFQQLQNGELDFYMLGWGVPTFDSEYIFNFLYHTRDGNRGSWNFTGFSSERMDELVEGMAGETDLDARNALLDAAWEIALDDLTYVPLHHEVLNWAMRSNVDIPIRADNSPRFASVTFK